jgi:hypothetical protein
LSTAMPWAGFSTECARKHKNACARLSKTRRTTIRLQTDMSKRRQKNTLCESSPQRALYVKKKDVTRALWRYTSKKTSQEASEAKD